MEKNYILSFKWRIKIEGENSKLITENINMYSDGLIEVNNLSGNFSLKEKVLN